MTSFAIEQGNEIPETVVTRKAEPNPFVDGKHFPTPEGKTVIVTLPSATDDEKKNVKKVVSLAQKAGRLCETTTRVKREEAGTKAKPQTRLIMWSVPKITRSRKDKAAAAE